MSARNNLILGSSDTPSSSSKSLCRYNAKARQAFANPSMKTPQVTRVTLKGRLLRGPCRWAPAISGELYDKAIVIANGVGRKESWFPTCEPTCKVVRLTYNFRVFRGVAQIGSALRSGRRGHRFKSGHPDLTKAVPAINRCGLFH